MFINELKSTVSQLAVAGKGILAADESHPTIAKRFESIHVEPTAENRRSYRDMLFSTPGIEEYISGVILFEETLGQHDSNGKPFPALLAERGIVPGIKVDKGLTLLPFTEEKITQGLDGLAERLLAFKQVGARFAKWRAVLTITEKTPSPLAIQANAEALARYAAICQSTGIVPIVEPELLMDGDHNLERCAEATEATLHTVFDYLYRHKVLLEYLLLKPSMVIAGTTCKTPASVNEVAQATLKVLRRTVPSAVPSINFLSGGQSPELATSHLHAINGVQAQPWLLSYSYGRALQETALKAWQGKPENKRHAQDELYKRAKLNSLASLGKL